MEEKKLSKGFHTLRSLFGFSHIYKHFLGKFNIGKRTKTSWNLKLISNFKFSFDFTQDPELAEGQISNSIKNGAGLTLIELVVVIMILAVITVIALGFMDPITQIHKVKDATRQNDLNQLYTALDTYYNDKGCYPTALSPQLDASAPIYIKKIPKDPDAPGVNYVYVVDAVTNNCPQWFNIITRGYRTSSSSPCPLEQLDTCLPINYTTSGYNFCKISGKVDCPFIINFTLPVLDISPIPSPTPTGVPSPTPVICYPTYYAVSADLCNLLFSGDPDNRCTIHDGPLVCYQAGGGLECSGPVCDQ